MQSLRCSFEHVATHSRLTAEIAETAEKKILSAFSACFAVQCEMRSWSRDSPGPRVPKSQVSSRRDERVPLPPQDDPVRALLLIEIEPLAVVAAHAFGLHDPRPANRSPFAGALA